MRLSAALAATFVLTPVAAGYTPAMSQDFSITNPEAPPAAFPGRRDLMRQLQAWWDVHAYYPRHASNSDEGGTVKVRLEVLPDGRIWAVKVIGSSGSQSLDTAAVAVFNGAFVTPAPEGTPEAHPEISLHYILAHPHDQPVDANYTPVLSKRPFTITNDPVKSPILETMLQRTCTGTVVKQGVRNHPLYGTPFWAQAVFFRRPDGTPWVKFYEGGYSTLAPVIEVGKMVQWTGREERTRGGASQSYQYTLWTDGGDNLNGNIDVSLADNQESVNHGGTVDFICATEIVPAVAWNAWAVNKVKSPPGDPP